jgi:hypothetical protein
VITVKGVFNGEAGLDLKLCRLVKAEFRVSPEYM